MGRLALAEIVLAPSTFQQSPKRRQLALKLGPFSFARNQ